MNTTKMDMLRDFMTWYLCYEQGLRKPRYPVPATIVISRPTNFFTSVLYMMRERTDRLLPAIPYSFEYWKPAASQNHFLTLCRHNEMAEGQYVRSWRVVK